MYIYKSPFPVHIFQCLSFFAIHTAMHHCQAQSLLWEGLVVEAATARQMATEDKHLRVEPMLPSLLTSGLGQTCPSPKLRTTRI